MGALFLLNSQINEQKITKNVVCCDLCYEEMKIGVEKKLHKLRE